MGEMLVLCWCYALTRRGHGRGGDGEWCRREGEGGSIVNEQKEVGVLKKSGTLVLLIYGGRGREVGRMRVAGRKG